MSPSLILRGLRARAATCLVCRSQRIRRSTRPRGWVASALGLVALRCEDCGTRFPLPQRLGTTRTRLRSELPQEHPLKESIEGRLLAALDGVPGKWGIDVLSASDSARWLIRMRGRGSVLRLSLPMDRLSPEAAFGAVREALVRAGLAR